MIYIVEKWPDSQPNFSSRSQSGYPPNNLQQSEGWRGCLSIEKVIFPSKDSGWSTGMRDFDNRENISIDEKFKFWNKLDSEFGRGQKRNPLVGRAI